MYFNDCFLLLSILAILGTFFKSHTCHRYHGRVRPNHCFYKKQSVPVKLCPSRDPTQFLASIITYCEKNTTGGLDWDLSGYEYLAKCISSEMEVNFRVNFLFLCVYKICFFFFVEVPDHFSAVGVSPDETYWMTWYRIFFKMIITTTIQYECNMCF